MYVIRFNSMKSKRLNKTHWVALGLSSLASDGIDAMSVDRLCEAAGKTKGSFYFHFNTIEDFLIAVTQKWKEKFTQEITQTIHSQTQRLDLLNQLAARIDLDLETGIRQLATHYKQVQKIVTQADSARIAWLTKLYEQSGKYNASDAAALANIEIAAFTGFKLIKPDMKPQEAREFYESFLKLTSRV